MSMKLRTFPDPEQATLASISNRKDIRKIPVPFESGWDTMTQPVEDLFKGISLLMPSIGFHKNLTMPPSLGDPSSIW